MMITLKELPSERRRLEDSYSLPENQRHYPDDDYVETLEKELIEKWHRKNIAEEMERLVHK